MLHNWPFDSEWLIKLVDLGVEVHRLIRKSSDHSWIPWQAIWPLALLPCVGGSSSNCAHLLGVFFLVRVCKTAAASSTSEWRGSACGAAQNSPFPAAFLSSFSLSGQIWIHYLDKWEQTLPQHLLLPLGGCPSQPAWRQSGTLLSLTFLYIKGG